VSISAIRSWAFVPALAKGEGFEHGSGLGGKTRGARVSAQWKSTRLVRRKNGVYLIHVLVAPEARGHKGPRGLAGFNSGLTAASKEARALHSAARWCAGRSRPRKRNRAYLPSANSGPRRNAGFPRGMRAGGQAIGRLDDGAPGRYCVPMSFGIPRRATSASIALQSKQGKFRRSLS
jgi:hypothetical protein